MPLDRPTVGGVAEMNGIQRAYAEMIKTRISPMLRSLGFKGSGGNYRIVEIDSIAVLGFQRSVNSSQDEALFTIDLSVSHEEARRLWDEARQENLLDQWRGYGDVVLIPVDVSWHWRLNELDPQRIPAWWSLRASTDVGELVGKVISAVRDVGLPAMKREMAREYELPGFVIETRGNPLGASLMPDGSQRHHNAGGVRLFPPGTQPLGAPIGPV